MPSITPIPANYLGADLVWWRNCKTFDTLISIHWSGYSVKFKAVSFCFSLFDEQGVCRHSWNKQVTGEQVLFIDSKTLSLPPEAREITEGVLAIFVVPEDSTHPHTDIRYSRMYTLVDWYSDTGEICTLHNDQSIVGEPEAQRFTEIVIDENAEQTNYLVFLGGEKTVPSGSLELEVRNVNGEYQREIYNREISPFSVNKVYFRDLFDDLEEFSCGKHLSVGGSFNSADTFLRPYVMTQSRRLSGYHGGNYYDSHGPQALKYQFLGNGEVNPMAVLHNEEVATCINIFNSHGTLEKDFWIDAELYDQEGMLVCEKKRWVRAERNACHRGEVAELLPPGVTNFAGHIALRFAPEKTEVYPFRVQALFEYRTNVNTSRVMVWSDEWNSEERRKRFGTVLKRKYFRVWHCPEFISYVSMYNCGVEKPYTLEAAFTLTLVNETGDKLIYEGTLPPNGTLFRRVDELFPDISAFLGDNRYAMLYSESAFDLAHVQFTRHMSSGVWAAEHFIASHTNSQGEYCDVAGS